MKNFKHNTVAIIFILSMTFGTITPVVANAAWWNPVDWFSFVVHIFSPSKKQESSNSGPKSQPAASSTPAPESAENPVYRVASTSRNNSQSNSSSGSSGSGGMQNDVPTPTITGGASTSPAHQNCPTTYQPVCGVDGTTYQNMCELQKAGIEYFYGSACTPAESSAQSNQNDTASGSGGTVCTSEYNPVCGTDGITYANYCEMQRSGATYFTGSTCPVQSSTTSSSSSGTSGSSSNTGATATTGTGGSGTVASSSNSGSSNSSSGSGTTGTTPTPTPASIFSCGLSATPRQSVNLAIRPGSSYYRPIPATTGTSIAFWTTVYNTGPDDMGEWRSENVGIGTRCYSTLYLRIDSNNDGIYDVLKKSDISQMRATDTNWVEHPNLKRFGDWTAVAGTHNWQICADGENLIDENNETDNCVSGTISVQ
jgi:hypothetical protein